MGFDPLNIKGQVDDSQTIASDDLDFPSPSSVTGAVAITGSSTLSETGVRTRLGSVAITGSSTLSASGVRTRNGAVTIAGSSTLSVSGTRTRLGAVTITGSSELSISGTVTSASTPTVGGGRGTSDARTAALHGQSVLRHQREEDEVLLLIGAL